MREVKRRQNGNDWVVCFPSNIKSPIIKSCKKCKKAVSSEIFDTMSTRVVERDIPSFLMHDQYTSKVLPKEVIGLDSRTVYSICSSPDD